MVYEDYDYYEPSMDDYIDYGANYSGDTDYSGSWSYTDPAAYSQLTPWEQIQGGSDYLTGSYAVGDDYGGGGYGAIPIGGGYDPTWNQGISSGTTTGLNWGSGLPTMTPLGNPGGLRSWMTNQTPNYVGLGDNTWRTTAAQSPGGSLSGIQAGSGGGGSSRRGMVPMTGGGASPAMGNMLNSMFQQYNANTADARARALADRARAEGSAQMMQDVLKSPQFQQAESATRALGGNPFGAQFLASSWQQAQDERARQLAAAEAGLGQHYAQMGRPVDPATLAMLRNTVAQQANADMRNLQIGTAAQRFGAQQSFAQAAQNMAQLYGSTQNMATSRMYDVLANTNYLPGQQDLALMMQLMSQIGAGGGSSWSQTRGTNKFGQP